MLKFDHKSLLNKLDSSQRRIWELFSKESEKAGRLYLMALRLTSIKEIPGSLEAAGYCIRETMDLFLTAVSQVEPKDKMQHWVEGLNRKWVAFKAETNWTVESSDLSQIGEQAINTVLIEIDEFQSKTSSALVPYRERLKVFVERYSPSPPGEQGLQVLWRTWDDLKQYFNSVLHHENPNLEQVEEQQGRLEDLILQILKPPARAIMNDIDSLIKRGEA